MNYALWLFAVVSSGLIIVCFSGMLWLPKVGGKLLAPPPIWLLAHLLFMAGYVYVSLQVGIEQCFDRFGSFFWLLPIIFGTSYGVPYLKRVSEAASKAPRLFGKEPSQGPK